MIAKWTTIHYSAMWGCFESCQNILKRLDISDEKNPANNQGTWELLLKIFPILLLR